MTRELTPFRAHVRARHWQRVTYGVYAPTKQRTLLEEHRDAHPS